MTEELRDIDTPRSASSVIEALGSVSYPSSPINSLHLLGLSFRTADLELRGKVSFEGDRRAVLLSRLKDAGASECLLLCTCNRTEVLHFGERGAFVRLILEEMAEIEPHELDGHLYEKHGREAAEHLFRVCAGLDSAVLGETEILAQVKEAWEAARSAGSSGPWLNLLVRHALSASKRVRSETNLCKGMTSISSLALREAGELCGRLDDKRVVLIGAGQLAERLARDLSSAKPSHVTVVNRHVERAAKLAESHGFSSVPLDRLEATLEEADIVVTAVGSKTPILSRETLARAMSLRNGRALTVIDLGVPENVEREAKRLPNVRAIDIDGLISRCAHNAEARESSVFSGGQIVDAAADQLCEAFAERESAEAIRALKERCEEIKEQNLTWALSRMPELGESQKKIVEDLALRMVRGLLDGPIRALKSGQVSREEREAVLRLFEVE